MTDVRAIQDWLTDRLTPERMTHVQGVYQTALHWAHRLNLDADTTQRIGLAALLHDNAKQWTADKLKQYLTDNNYHWQPEDVHFPAIWHAWAGALEANAVWGITDTDCLNAIHFHTTGRPAMSLVEQLVFVADKIEPATRPTVLVDAWQQQVKTLPGNGSALGELQNWVKVLLGNNLRYLSERHFAIHPSALAAWNAILWQSSDPTLYHTTLIPVTSPMEDRSVVSH